MLYLDYNGSAPLRSSVENFLKTRLENRGPYANPNASHFLGSKCLMAIEKSRRNLAKFLDCENHQIIFNSGSTEGISSVFLHTYFKFKDTDRKIILVSDTEHAAPINESTFLENHGFKTVFIPTKRDGETDLDFLQKCFIEHKNEIALVAIMAANNETGVIQPYERIAKMCQEVNAPYLCDTTQILGKASFSFKNCDADFITVSGHKLGALPGVGALILKTPNEFIPTIHGGNQESGLRGGTQNYVGIESLNVAVEELMQKSDCHQKIEQLRDDFETKLVEKFSNIIIFGKNANRICNTSFISLPNTNASDIQDALQMQKIFVTTSSACSDQSSKSSRVLSKMNIPENQASGAVRISFCSSNTKEDFQQAFDVLSNIYEKIQ